MSLSSEMEGKTCNKIALPVYIITGLAIVLVGENVGIDFEVEVNNLGESDVKTETETTCREELAVSPYIVRISETVKICSHLVILVESEASAETSEEIRVEQTVSTECRENVAKIENCIGVNLHVVPLEVKRALVEVSVTRNIGLALKSRHSNTKSEDRVEAVSSINCEGR